jgi:hypothetical protein
MNLGKTLVGGLLGGAIGVGLQVALEVFGKIEATWFPIVIGLLCGLGVRKLDASAATGVSYFRGAVAGLISIGAIVSGPNLVAKVRSMQPTQGIAKAVANADAGAKKPDEDGENVADVPPPVEVRTQPTGKVGPPALAQRPKDFSTAQFVFMAVGILLAYEFARGTEVRFPEADENSGGAGDSPVSDATPDQGDQGNGDQGDADQGDANPPQDDDAK